MNNLSTLNGALTMSSTEIAALTGKRKNDIHQDIKTQLFIGLYGLKDGGDFHHEQIQGITVVLDNRDYWSEVLLDRYHADILVSGYEVKYRAAIVKRWHELEGNIQQFNIPQTLPEALRQLADEVEAKQSALKTIESQKETIQHKDELIIASNEAGIKAGEILVREFVKSNDLIDLGEHQFYDWMREQGYIFKKDREPYQKYVKLGYFTWKPTQEQHGGKFRHTLRITPRGKVWLAHRYLSYLDSELAA